MIKKAIQYFFAIFLLFFSYPARAQHKKQATQMRQYTADHSFFQYTGRVDFSNKKLPRYWNPGVYVTARFAGNQCEIVVNDEVAKNKNHNQLEIQIDKNKPYKILLQEKINRIVIDAGAKQSVHTIVICKNTESIMGYVEFAGLRCNVLLAPPAKPFRKIEFIGNSITCGTGSDVSAIPCGKGGWQDQHNAYLSYGPLTARKLQAQWMLTAVSGIGLVHSCCNLPIIMPQVFDKINLFGDSIVWDAANYQPDVLTICLGENDGIQDSSIFCNSYIAFLKNLRLAYPASQIILLNSPMADASLNNTLNKFVTAVKKNISKEDKKVSTYFFQKRYNHGCDNHPNLQEHQQIAAELSRYIKIKMKW